MKEEGRWGAAVRGDVVPCEHACLRGVDQAASAAASAAFGSERRSTKALPTSTTSAARPSMTGMARAKTTMTAPTRNATSGDVSTRRLSSRPACLSPRLTLVRDYREPPAGTGSAPPMAVAGVQVPA